MEKAKHKIIMGGYRLSNDVNFSRKILECYYDNEETNARFCKSILSERSYYFFESGVIKTKKIKYHVNGMIYIITILLYINIFYVKSSAVIYNVHLPAEPVIIIATGIYSYLSWKVLCGYLSTQLNKKKFYNFLRQDNG